ncbi:MAG: hypothetical protein M1817_006916 [Caeruleum heppii]|nr:MAG: hypothetical protein M1817_006916 [Caeruleum heppii]
MCYAFQSQEPLLIIVAATANAKQSLEYGTKIVGDVVPGRTGQHLGLPVLPTVRAAKEALQPDATAVFVAAPYAAKAIEEAVEAEIPLIIAVAEHVPIHDIMKIHSILKTQSKSRLVGANSPGIISPLGNCRIGFQPLSCFSPGNIGIVAKSGTLSYEAVASTTRAGLGQSLVIGMGGDVVSGTTFVDALKVFERDDATQGILLIGELGGRAEEDAAEWIEAYHQRTESPKPILALVAGLQAAPGRVMGHAGAFMGPGDASPHVKTQALEDVGVKAVRHPADFGECMKDLLDHSSALPSNRRKPPGGQKRGLCTIALKQPFFRRKPCKRHDLRKVIGPPTTSDPLGLQRRTFYVKQPQSTDMLQERGVKVSKSHRDGVGTLSIAISIDRSVASPCVIASRPGITPPKRLPFDYRMRLSDNTILEIAEHLQLESSSSHATRSLTTYLEQLVNLFMEKEAFHLETSVNYNRVDHTLEVLSAHFGFDDAAYKSAKRQEDVHRMRAVEHESAEEVEAKEHGIVYIKLKGDGNIVNGAGLAMNTNDALAQYGGHSANFLDTGGKATSDTVKTSFDIILRDRRVKVIFVNIFGGLTLCDMIARGILLAFEELHMEIPVVVRLRGTNEREGQKIIAESGLPLFAYDDFEEAALKVVELAGRT